MSDDEFLYITGRRYKYVRVPREVPGNFTIKRVPLEEGEDPLPPWTPLKAERTLTAPNRTAVAVVVTAVFSFALGVLVGLAY